MSLFCQDLMSAKMNARRARAKALKKAAKESKKKASPDFKVRFSIFDDYTLLVNAMFVILELEYFWCHLLHNLAITVICQQDNAIRL